jgi:hypothetical protein
MSLRLLCILLLSLRRTLRTARIILISRTHSPQVKIQNVLLPLCFVRLRGVHTHSRRILCYPACELLMLRWRNSQSVVKGARHREQMLLHVFVTNATLANWSLLYVRRLYYIHARTPVYIYIYIFMHTNLERRVRRTGLIPLYSIRRIA